MIFTILGVIYLLVSLGYFFKPEVIVKVNNWMAKSLFMDEGVIKHRTAAGLFFGISAVLMFIFGYLFTKWELSEIFAEILF